jgi:hypothetical protein
MYGVHSVTYTYIDNVSPTSHLPRFPYFLAKAYAILLEQDSALGIIPNGSLNIVAFIFFFLHILVNRNLKLKNLVRSLSELARVAREIYLDIRNHGSFEIRFSQSELARVAKFTWTHKIVGRSKSASASQN